MNGLSTERAELFENSLSDDFLVLTKKKTKILMKKEDSREANRNNIEF